MSRHMPARGSSARQGLTVIDREDVVGPEGDNMLPGLGTLSCRSSRRWSTLASCMQFRVAGEHIHMVHTVAPLHAAVFGTASNLAHLHIMSGGAGAAQRWAWVCTDSGWSSRACVQQIMRLVAG